MTITPHEIIKIQAEQLTEWVNHPNVFKHLLEQALQRNYKYPQDAAPGMIWRGQDIDHEAVAYLKTTASR